MFLPVLNFEDGYGFTYGVRFARRTSPAAQPAVVSADLGRRQARRASSSTRTSSAAR